MVLLDVMNQMASIEDPDYDVYKLKWLCSLFISITHKQKHKRKNLRKATFIYRCIKILIISVFYWHHFLTKASIEQHLTLFAYAAYACEAII